MHLSNMARVNKDSANKKNPRQLQLKKSRKVVEVHQEEDNDNYEDMDNSDKEEEAHDYESDKELVLDLEKDDDDENDNDMDEGFQKKELSTLQKKSNQIKMKKKEQGKKKEEEEDHDLESDKAEDKELGLGLEKDDDDENINDEEKDDDMDEGFHNKDLSTSQKKTKQIEVEEREHGRERAVKSLYVSKLPYDVTEQDLKDLSKDIVEICIFKNEHGSSHLRCAIISFNDKATAETNYNILQTKKIKDQLLTIDYLGSTGSRRRREREARSLSVQKLPDGVTKQDLKDLSKDIVEICIPRITKDYIRFAILRFIDEATAETNYNILQTKKIKDKPLTIDYFGSKSLFSRYARQEEGDPRTLFFPSLPDDITEQELRSLSKDIVDIDIRQDRKPFAFLIFDSQAKAKSNYKILNSQKLRGKPISVIYKDSKTALVKGGQDHNRVKQLSVSGLPLDVTIEQVATHFKKAFQITLNRSNLFRTATVSFDTEEEAKEANDAAKDAKISEYKLITVLCENLEKRPFRATEFRGAPFRGAPFRGALFRGASFRGAPFRGASFRGAPFRGASFRGAPFRGGRNNWGKRGHNDNFPDGQRFAKKMRP